MSLHDMGSGWLYGIEPSQMIERFGSEMVRPRISAGTQFALMPKLFYPLAHASSC